jgi:hypothetical protein
MSASPAILLAALSASTITIHSQKVVFFINPAKVLQDGSTV